MFELKIGEKLSIRELYLREAVFPFLLVGKTGQGKSYFLMKLVLELIRNRETGVLYDPFGSLTEAIQDHLETGGAKAHVKTFTQDEAIDFQLTQSHFLLVRGNTLSDGFRATRAKAQEVLMSAFDALGEKQWLVIDDAFHWLNDDLFEEYTKANGPKRFLSCQGFLELSDDERRRIMFSLAQGVFVYKPTTLDAKWLCEHYKRFDMKSMMAIKQYHFQYLCPYGEKGTPDEIKNRPSYDTVPYPQPKV